MGCFTSIFLVALFVFVLVSLIRWFEQTAEAVDERAWGRVRILILMPFSVWFFPSRIAAGRPSPVAHHEPVRGFGSLPKSPAPAANGPAEAGPPLKKPAQTGADPELIAKLKEKMRQQGMLPPNE